MADQFLGLALGVHNAFNDYLSAAALDAADLGQHRASFVNACAALVAAERPETLTDATLARIRAQVLRDYASEIDDRSHCDRPRADREIDDRSHCDRP